LANERDHKCGNASSVGLWLGEIKKKKAALMPWQGSATFAFNFQIQFSIDSRNNRM